MSKRSFKNYFISLLLISSLFLNCISTFATTTSIDSDFNNFYTSIKNIQNQLNSISNTIYIHKREDKPLNSIQTSLLTFDSQINQLNSNLSTYSNDKTLDTIYTVRLETLTVAARLLNSLVRDLKEQLITTDKNEEYQLFKAYIIADSLLNQTLAYFPVNQ